MIVEKELTIAPVKSTRLVHPDKVFVTDRGIVEDRRFFIIDNEGNVVTQKQLSTLALVTSDYDMESERLAIHLPDGSSVEGVVELGEPIVAPISQRQAHGRMVRGNWNSLLTDFCGEPLRLVQSELPGEALHYPLAILSQASVEELNLRASEYGIFEQSRFRLNVLLDGCTPHEEDQWLGCDVQMGEQLVVRVERQAAMCAVTTINPETGERDLDTLRAIATYRPRQEPNPRIYFGVFASVKTPGFLRVGDSVSIL